MNIITPQSIICQIYYLTEPFAITTPDNKVATKGTRQKKVTILFYYYKIYSMIR